MRAVVLPGRRYGHEQPGLRLTETALEDAGLDVVRVEWPTSGMPTEPAETAAAVAEIVTPLLDDATAYLVAKSLGTLAAPLAAQRGIAAIWLTPLLDEPICRVGILANPGRQLLVGGDLDAAWQLEVAHEAASRGAHAVTLPRTNHGLFVEGDDEATERTLQLLDRAVREFVAE